MGFVIVMMIDRQIKKDTIQGDVNGKLATANLSQAIVMKVAVDRKNKDDWSMYQLYTKITFQIDIMQ